MGTASNTQYAPWNPMTDIADVRTIGKLAEELGECQAAAARCLIQGINECEPTTLKINKTWLEEEISDILAAIARTVQQFNLNDAAIQKRAELKFAKLKEWQTGKLGEEGQQ